MTGYRPPLVRGRTATHADPRLELSARTGFAGNRLFRDSELRRSDTLAGAIADPRARVYLLHEGQWLCRTASGSGLLPDFGWEEAEAYGATPEETILLGFAADDAPRLAAPIRSVPESDDLALIDLRSLGLQRVLDPDIEGQLAQAAHLLGWHSRNGFCARCGGRTVAEAAGCRRRCTACCDTIFPRTDPVTIMLVHDGAGSCILGRQPKFPENFWSCLAGFVEAGETIEDAVRRETLEEAGIAVGAVTYLASQPWPFPGSLMIGCAALATSTRIDFDTDELEACRWFEREEVRLILAGAHPDGLQAPSEFAIAHHLIKAFADKAV